MLIGGLWHGASWRFIVWGALHGFGLAITRFFQRATAGDRHRAWSLLARCLLLAIAGHALQRFVLHELSTWWQLVIAWVYLTPLWAVITAWLGREPAPHADAASAAVPVRELWGHAPHRWVPRLLRIFMCGAGLAFFAALAYGEAWTWIPLIAITWALGIAADVAERGGAPVAQRLLTLARRTIAVVLVFQYVCLAWIFFRAPSFETALAVLRQLALLETDHANLVPLVTVALAAGFAGHFFADGSFRWLRDRFVALPAYAQGFVLACAALLLRELGDTKIVQFIYFQF
jgi:D-alanyl-lipoteichoic acid acyltransferase DltB (MBOAT superfamily)